MSRSLQVNKVKEDLDKTIKVLLDCEDLKIVFDENLAGDFFSLKSNLILNENEILLPFHKLEDPLEVDEVIKKHRPLADLAICYYLFHDKNLHQELTCDSLEGEVLFDEFEKIRVILNVKNHYLGCQKNILSKIQEDVIAKLDVFNWALQSDKLELNNQVFEILPLVLLEDSFKEKLNFQVKDLIFRLRKKLDEKTILKIKNLSKKIDDQEGFLRQVLKVFQDLTKDDERKSVKEDFKDNKNSPDENISANQENVEQENNDDSSDEESLAQEVIEEERPRIQELKEDKMAGKIKQKLEKQDFYEEKIEYKNPYKVFTNKFDEIVFPQKFLPKNELENLRNRLEIKMEKLLGVSKKMSLKLKRKLISKKNSFVEYNSGAGILDKKKLTRLIIDPSLEDVFVKEKTHEYNNIALTILLDNSGSMRGNPITMSAMACEIIADILEKFSVKTEIIGFTTADWRGGRARKLWESSNSPKNPGRLNEIRHIIYKSFDQNFKKSKINLGLMLKEGILKENIDGEALLFAKSRLMQRSETRKIMMVISDGTPVDDSTSLVNDDKILIDHLNLVINNIEKKSKIEIVGIGIGHATDDFYQNSITIKALEELGDVMIEKIINLI